MSWSSCELKRSFVGRGGVCALSISMLLAMTPCAGHAQEAWRTRLFVPGHVCADGMTPAQRALHLVETFCGDRYRRAFAARKGVEARRFAIDSMSTGRSWHDDELMIHAVAPLANRSELVTTALWLKNFARIPEAACLAEASISGELLALATPLGQVHSRIHLGTSCIDATVENSRLASLLIHCRPIPNINDPNGCDKK